MRKIIVKHFALDAWVVLFGRVVNFPRASRVISPLFVLAGVAEIYQSFEAITLILCAIAIFFGFVYFRFKPVDYWELNDVQKFQYGVKKQLTMEQELDYYMVIERIKKKYPML